MTGQAGRDPALWSIVLAGGDGERLRPFIERWRGRAIPKQYCTFTGTRSMLDHTLDRAAQLCPPDRILTVVADAHRRELHSRWRRPSDGRFLAQPANHGTAAGVLLGLSYVLAIDPDATVAVFPSDHFIFPEWRFLDRVRTALAAARALGDRVVLLGVTPDAPEPDYGWVVPGAELTRVGGRPCLAVNTFVEKPSAADARALHRRGGLWNTLVLVTRARVLWDLAGEHLTDLTPGFERFRAAIGTPTEVERRAALYAGLPVRNLSSDLLQRAVARMAIFPLEGVQWSDWGRAERIVDSLRSLGVEAAFRRSPLPMALLDRHRPAS